MSESNSVWKAYRFPIILLCAIAVGCVIGAVMGKDALVLKPLGDLFINDRRLRESAFAPRDAAADPLYDLLRLLPPVPR